MAGHGYLPYRDFWTNNSPLFIYLLKLLVRHYDENPSSLLVVGRLLVWGISLLLLWLAAGLAARRQSWAAGLFAAVLLSVNVTVFHFTLEVRHDSLTVICELLALALLARGIRSERRRDVLASRPSYGVGVTLGCWSSRASERSASSSHRSCPSRPGPS